MIVVTIVRLEPKDLFPQFDRTRLWLRYKLIDTGRGTGRGTTSTSLLVYNFAYLCVYSKLSVISVS